MLLLTIVCLLVVTMKGTQVNTEETVPIAQANEPSSTETCSASRIFSLEPNQIQSSQEELVFQVIADENGQTADHWSDDL